jgi:hypothetical protein
MIRVWHRSSETSRRLEDCPGVGPVLATAIVATVANPKVFRSGRNFSAWIGIVPIVMVRFELIGRNVLILYCRNDFQLCRDASAHDHGRRPSPTCRRALHGASHDYKQPSAVDRHHDEPRRGCMYRAIGKSCHVVPGKVPRQGWLNQQQHQSNRILPCVNNSAIEFDWQPTIAAWPLKSRRKVICNLERRLAPDHP